MKLVTPLLMIVGCCSLFFGPLLGMEDVATQKEASYSAMNMKDENDARLLIERLSNEQNYKWINALEIIVQRSDLNNSCWIAMIELFVKNFDDRLAKLPDECNGDLFALSRRFDGCRFKWINSECINAFYNNKRLAEARKTRRNSLVMQTTGLETKKLVRTLHSLNSEGQAAIVSLQAKIDEAKGLNGSSNKEDNRQTRTNSADLNRPQASILDSASQESRSAGVPPSKQNGTGIDVVNVIGNVIKFGFGTVWVVCFVAGLT